MFAVKPIIDSLKRQFNISTDAKEANLWDLVREAYYELCGEASWSDMRDSITYTYDSDEDGMWLPSDLIGIDCVTNGEHIWRKSGKASALDENSIEKKWFVSDVAQRALVSGTDITINNGEASFSGASSITSAHVGEYIRIGSDNAFYKLASATELATPYLGADRAGAAYAVRPAGTQKIKLVKEYGVTDETAATIFFWRYPEQLYAETQLMLLPRADVLELAVAEKHYAETREVEMKNSVQKDLYGSKGRYAGKLDLAKAANPEFVAPIKPVNSTGRIAGWGARN